MPSRADDADERSSFIITREQAEELVANALFTDFDEPEPFVKLLVILYDNAREPDIRYALHQLMKVAYDNSIVHSSDFQEYVDAIRHGNNPLKLKKPAR